MTDVLGPPFSGLSAIALKSLPLWAVVGLSGFIGVVVGSFLNVVVYRVPRRLSVVRPPSFCPRCRTPVRPRDNIPVVSWLALGGRCRDCGEPISVRYPLVEAGTGLLFALVAVAVGPRWAVPGLCALAAAVAASAAVELDGLRPPAAVPVVGTAVGLALLAAAAVADRRWSHLVGGATGVGVAVVLAVVSMRSAPAEGRGRLRGAGWALLPAGAVAGWAGPLGSAAGIGALGVLVLLLPSARRPRPEAQPGGLGASGTAVAVAVACVVAVAVASATGSPLGR